MTKATEKWLKNIYFIVSINKQEANQNLREDHNFKAATETAQQRQESERERGRVRRGCAEVAKQFSTRLSVGLDFFITHTHTHAGTHTPEYAHTHTHAHETTGKIIKF